MRILVLCLLLFATLAYGLLPTWKMPVRTYQERQFRANFRHRSSGKCHIGPTNACAMSDMDRQEYEVMSVYPGGKTQCLNPGSPYQFKVYPGSTNNVLIYFQGGGGCWDEFSTNTFPLCNKNAQEYSHGHFGVFERREPSNPYRDWTIVNILLCSGDTHVGNVTFSYSNRPVHQVGAENVAAVYDWIEQQNWTPSKLVLMGSSAGAIGVQFHAASFLSMIEYETAAVVLDSFLVIDSDEPFYRHGLQKFRTCFNDQQWSWNAKLQEQCHRGELSIDTVLIETMRAFPDVTFATINSKVDWVQRLFYLVNLKRYLSKRAYYRKMAAQMRHFATQPNFVAYMINGGEHELTDYHELYYTYTAGPNKHNHVPTAPKEDSMPLLQWIAKLPLDDNQTTTIRSHCLGNRVDNLEHLKLTDCDRQVFP